MTSRRVFLAASATSVLASATIGPADAAGHVPGGTVRPQRPAPDLRALLRQVDERRIEATVRRLAAFGTRHTLSSQDDPVRGRRRSPTSSRRCAGPPSPAACTSSPGTTTRAAATS